MVCTEMDPFHVTDLPRWPTAALMPSEGKGGSGSLCEQHVTYAERGFGLASKSDTRGDGGLFLDEYYRFTLSFAAVRPRGYITAGRWRGGLGWKSGF